MSMETAKIVPCEKCAGTIGVWKLDMGDHDATEILLALVCYRCGQTAEVQAKTPRSRKAACAAHSTGELT